MSDPDLLTPMEAAQLLGVRVRDVYAMLDNEQLTIVRVKDAHPGSVRVSRGQIEEIISSRNEE